MLGMDHTEVIRANRAVRTLGNWAAGYRVMQAYNAIAELVRDAIVGPQIWTVLGTALAPPLGNWTADCTDMLADSTRLYGNIAMQDQFLDVDHLAQHPNWRSAGRAAIRPLAACSTEYRTRFADDFPSTWVDVDAARVLAELMQGGTTRIVEITSPDPSGSVTSDWTAANEARTEIDCSYPYPARSSIDGDVVICGANADGAHTCWIGTDRRTLDCAVDVWKRTYLKYRSLQILDPVPAADDPQPEWIELDNGLHCSARHGGAWDGRTDGLVGAYWCGTDQRAVLVEYDGDPIDKSTDGWTVRIGELGSPGADLPPPETVGVTAAYFAVQSS